MSFLDDIVSAKPPETVNEKADIPLPPCRTIPLPPMQAITCIQAAFLDNGATRTTKTKKKNGDPRKSNGQRYKMTLEIWTTPPPVNNYFPQYKRSVELRDPDAFIALIDGQLNDGLISEDYHALLRGIVPPRSDPNRARFMFGQLWEVREGGRHYEEMKYLVVTSNAAKEMVAILSSHSDVHVIEGFNTLFAKNSIKFTTKVYPNS